MVSYAQFIFYLHNNIEFMRQYILNIWVYQFYMIKYILQKYVNPNDHTHENQQKLKATTEDHVTNYSTTALKNLKQTQDNIDALKRRLSVLSIKDKKNQKKLQQNLKKLEFHSKVQESIARDKTKKQRYQQKVKRQLQETKQKIQEFKKDHTDNLQSAKSSLFQNKKRDYEKIKKQSDQMEKSLEKRKIQQISSKANQRKAIYQMEKLQKEHIVEYFLKKKSSFRDSSVRQGSQYDSRRSQRQRLLQELSARESQLIQRQSASRAALDESAKRMPKISIAKSMHRQRSTSDYSQLMPPIGRNQQYIFS